MDKTVQFNGGVSNIESNANKVQEITGKSTTTQYPSAKAVKNALKRYLSLDAESEIIFDGGDASGEVDIDFVIDDVMSSESDNPVKNKAVKEYVDSNISATILPAMTVCLEEETSYGGVQDALIPLNKVIGECNNGKNYLINENGSIKIVEGITHVMVSGQLFAQCTENYDYIWGSIKHYKASGDFTEISYTLGASSPDFAILTFTPILIPVEPGDYFVIIKKTSATVLIRNEGNTYLTVQALKLATEEETTNV